MRRAVVVAVIGLGLVVAGCGKSAPSDYNDATEQTFIETCTDQAGEQDVCQCAYDSFKRDIPFDRFQRVDDRLRENPESNLPDDFIDIYTNCVVQFGGGAAGTTPEFPTTTTTAADPGASTTVTGDATATTGPAVTDATAAP